MGADTVKHRYAIQIGTTVALTFLCLFAVVAWTNREDGSPEAYWSTPALTLAINSLSVILIFCFICTLSGKLLGSSNDKILLAISAPGFLIECLLMISVPFEYLIIIAFPNILPFVVFIILAIKIVCNTSSNDNCRKIAKKDTGAIVLGVALICSYPMTFIILHFLIDIPNYEIKTAFKQTNPTRLHYTASHLTSSPSS